MKSNKGKFPAMVKQLEQQSGGDLLQDDPLEKTKSLISALNYVSRDLILPCHLYASVSSIYHHVSPPVTNSSRLYFFVF